eukprot:Gb_13689 [translate_table: standard]
MGQPADKLVLHSSPNGRIELNATQEVACIDQAESKNLDVAIVMPAFKDQQKIVSTEKEEEEEEEKKNEKKINYNQRGQWLRAAVLGANDGLVSTASLMMGVGAVKQDAKSMVISGLAALVAGACSMAIGEFVSVYTQRDIELSNIKRAKEVNASDHALRKNTPSAKLQLHGHNDSAMPSSSASSSTSCDMTALSQQGSDGHGRNDELIQGLPNPIQAAAASALAFTVGALVPLISAAFIENYNVRVGVVAGVSSVALATFGAVGAFYGRSSVIKSSLRVLIGGWLAMLVTYGLLRLFASSTEHYEQEE